MRKPFQGVVNIILFNWHYFVISIGLILLLLFVSNQLNSSFSIIIKLLCLSAFLSILLSLFVSFYVYDLSNLYQLNWVDLGSSNKYKIINISAGFDETSGILERKFSNSELIAMDFYDKSKHTEISIKRARRKYPPFPNTQQITTLKLPSEDNSIDKIFLFLAAHEIRDSIERTLFFAELKRVLKQNGEIILTEHLQDIPNFLAYNIGAFHFHTKKEWVENIGNAKLKIAKEFKITPFITTFILKKNGDTS